MKNMIINLGSGLYATAYTRGGQTRYRMGDSLVEEADPATVEMKKYIKEFVEKEDKESLDEMKKLVNEKEAEKETDKDSSEPAEDAGTQEEGDEDTEEDSEF